MKGKEKMETTGIYTVKRTDKTPDWVILKFGIKIEDAKQFINDKGYLNIQVLKSKAGNPYAAIDDYKSEKKDENKEQPNDEEIPF